MSADYVPYTDFPACPQCGNSEKVSIPWLQEDEDRGSHYCEACKHFFTEADALEASVAAIECQAVADRIALADDVKRVVGVERLQSGRFRYLIETPFATFPKFVIGTIDQAGQDVRIVLKCGAEWNALRHWERGVGQPGVPAIDPEDEA